MYHFAAARQTSTTTLPVFFQKFKKTVRPLRVNETKVTLRNAFIVNLFALVSENNPKMTKGHSVNPYAPNVTYMRLSGLF